MKVAVVILNWNAAKDTERSLSAVEAWERIGYDDPPTLWVVDNGSVETGLDEIKAGHPDVRFLCSRTNRGFAGGNNLGISAALAEGSDGILLLNNDATLPAVGLASMIAALSRHADLGVVGPLLWHGDRLLSAGGRNVARHTVTHLRPTSLPSHPFDVDHVSGTAALVHRRVFERVGLLDEDYFFGAEMADLCCRARQEGIRSIIDPTAHAQHDLTRSSEMRATLHQYYVLRNRFLYVRKHHREHVTSLYCLWTLRGMRALVAAIVRGERRRARAIGLSLLDGWRGRFGGQNDRVLVG